ncbi:hypothetical protein O3M35_011322 [Rhynocoris fuscipes]|uniref:Glomulin n=1 Tax=Rhynocoris fuscipes TaxID=488301 RepID=A0AAW1D112_9HEMI
MDTQEFISSVEKTLKEKPEDAINILRDPINSEVLGKCCWELIPRLSANLTEEYYIKNVNIYDCTVDLLLEIANTANPEDVFFEFIELAEKQKFFRSFINILRAIRILLMRAPQRRGTSISWCCSAIGHYLSEINLPQNSKLEGDEELILENDVQFQLVEEVYIEVLDFFSPFIEEIESGNYTVSEKHIDIYKDTLLKYLLKLFGHPLVSTYLEHSNNKSAFRRIAEKILQYIACFHIDFFSFLEYATFSSKENINLESEFNNLSLGVFYYLILVEGLYINEISHVYSNLYLFRQILWLCLTLMNSEDSRAHWKGLSLAENILKRIVEKELDFKKIDRFQSQEFVQLCSKIMIYSDSKRNRQKAVAIFTTFIRIFNPCGRYYLLLCIPEKIKEPGLIGYLSVKAKDFIAEALLRKNLEELKYFNGKCLHDLIKKFCSLENDTETDLMRYADQIVPSLNLLRYLVLRDKTNFTGIFDLIPILEKTYFSPLQKAIEISRAHYNLQKKEIHQSSGDSNQKFPTAVSVGGENLPEFSLEQKLQILNNALNMFDLIESLLTRLTECINDQS